MLEDNIHLPGSYKGGPPIYECSRCNTKRQRNDGIDWRGKFICGQCWRFGAVRQPSKKKAVK